jgi:hypothetical protein
MLLYRNDLLGVEEALEVVDDDVEMLAINAFVLTAR